MPVQIWTVKLVPVTVGPVVPGPEAAVAVAEPALNFTMPEKPAGSRPVVKFMSFMSG